MTKDAAQHSSWTFDSFISVDGPVKLLDAKIMTTSFGLLRHAETVWNRERRIQGQQDSPLTAEGQCRAEEWGGNMRLEPWTRIVASDLGRAQRTAAAINRSLALPVTLDPRLREQDWGEWTGQKLHEIRMQNRADFKAAGEDWDFHPPGGEPRRAVLARGQEAIMSAARIWPGERILIITHEGMLKSLLYHLLMTAPSSGAPLRVQPGYLHHLQCDGRTLLLKELNAVLLA